MAVNALRIAATIRIETIRTSPHGEDVAGLASTSSVSIDILFSSDIIRHTLKFFTRLNTGSISKVRTGNRLTVFGLKLEDFKLGAFATGDVKHSLLHNDGTRFP